MEKVCAYCRVSTDSKEQESSFENQRAYFERELSKENGFNLIKIYADKGLTGTVFDREQFLDMLYDAGLDYQTIKGKLIFTTSDREPLFKYICVSNTSRFARNILIVDIIRELRKKKVYIKFMDWGKSTEDDDIETFLKTVGEKLSDLCGQVDLGGGYYKEPNKAKTSQSKKEDVADTKHNTDKPETVESTPSTDKNTDSKVEQPQQSNMYEPKFICPNCSCNIFETGYSISEKVNYKYSKDAKKLVVTSKEQENAVTCSKCGYTIEQLNPAFLENICTVQNCKKCGKDLTSAGIVTKMKTEYDSESNSFITSKKSFHCAECDSELTDYQVNYFKL